MRSLAAFLAKCGALSLQPVFLEDKHEQGDAQKDDRHRGSALLIIGAGDLKVDRRCQCVIGAADDHGVCKVGDRLDKGNQKCVAKSRKEPEERVTGKYLPAGGAHLSGRLLREGSIFLRSPLASSCSTPGRLVVSGLWRSPRSRRHCCHRYVEDTW